jgi:hypothetical protein
LKIDPSVLDLVIDRFQEVSRIGKVSDSQDRAGVVLSGVPRLGSVETKSRLITQKRDAWWTTTQARNATESCERTDRCRQITQHIVFPLGRSVFSPSVANKVGNCVHISGTVAGDHLNIKPGLYSFFTAAQATRCAISSWSRVVGVFLPGVIKRLSRYVLCVFGKMVSNPWRQVVVGHLRHRSTLPASP